MDSSKKRRGRKRALEILFPNFDFPEGFDQSKLKNFYSIFIKLSSNEQWKTKYAKGSNEFHLKICHEGIKLTFGDICELSNVLFQTLEERFEQLFSELSAFSAAKDLGESSSTLSLFDAVEVLNLLFRCCMLLLALLAAQQSVIFEKGSILLKILRKLMLPNLTTNSTGEHAFVFEKSVFRECAPQDNGCSRTCVEGFVASIEFLEPCNPLLFLKCTMLEAFVDELLAHKQVTRYIKMINSVAATSDMLFNSNSAQGDSGILMEAICSHFMQSFSDRQAFADFLSRLFCMHAMKSGYPFRPPALGFTAAVSLFLNPVMSTAPEYLQAHLTMLVSEVVCIENSKPDREHTNCFLSIFEKSVILYMRHMSHLLTDNCSILNGGSASSSSHEFVYPLFESYISLETKGKVDALISRLDSTSTEVLDGSFSEMKSDMVDTSLRFVKDWLNAYTMSCPEEILSILSCLVLKASESCNDNSIRPIEATTLQHVYLLTSLLKLMSISLLQAIRCVGHSDDLSCSRNLKYFSSCKEYDCILGTIACFKDLDISLPLQQDLYTLISSHSTRHMDSKMMFLHFSGLMSLGFVTGLDCIVKACLLTNLALLNLFVFEEGDLGALHSLVDSRREYVSSGLPVVRFQERTSYQSSSLVVASRFCKMRSLYSRVVENKHNEKGSLCLQTLGSASHDSHMEAAACTEEEAEETCSGEIFLKSVLGVNVSEFDDLVGFVECKEGKDYRSWLKNRRRFRKWKSEKAAVVKWKSKKKIWKIQQGKKTG